MDLVTTLDASGVYDATDVGRLTSPLFSQEREVRANRSVQTHSSSFTKPLSKGKANQDLESVQDSQMEREKSLSEQRDIHDFLE